LVYDAQKLSFLFDLNADWTIDAAKMGNLSRFVNHSSKDANCVAKVLLTNLEHRIGFFAAKNIEPGTELFFDYGKDYVTKYGLKERNDSSRVHLGAGVGKGKAVKRGRVLASKFAVMEDVDVDMSKATLEMSESEYEDGPAEGRRPRRAAGFKAKYTR